MMPGLIPIFKPRSVNIFLTDLCNRDCPFCYLKGWTKHDESEANHISYENLKKIINWLKKSGIYQVKLAGGEPMLHPQIISFIKELIKNDIIIDGILTNGLGETQLYKEIEKMTNTNWLVNVTNPETYSHKEWELLNKNLDVLKWKNKFLSVKKFGFDVSSLRHLCLSITFYEENQDYEYIINLAKKYECPVIRYDISRPAPDKNNIYVDFEKLIKLKPVLIEFVKRCIKEQIKPGVDDVLPFCIFTQEELKFLHLFSNFYSVCIPHMDLMPDLKVYYCTSMRGILPSYEIQKMTAYDMFKNFMKETEKYRNFKLPRCEGCYNFNRKLCQGFCLRYKADYLFKNKQKRKWSIFKI